jgi:hypothetical protein
MQFAKHLSRKKKGAFIFEKGEKYNREKLIYKSKKVERRYAG